METVTTTQAAETTQLMSESSLNLNESASLLQKNDTQINLPSEIMTLRDRYYDLSIRLWNYFSVIF